MDNLDDLTILLMYLIGFCGLFAVMAWIADFLERNYPDRRN